MPLLLTANNYDSLSTKKLFELKNGINIQLNISLTKFQLPSPLAKSLSLSELSGEALLE